MLIKSIGGVLLALGIICVLGGLAVRTVYPSGGVMLWARGVMTLTGFLICYLVGLQWGRKRLNLYAQSKLR